jgi:hypothetical protein
MQDVHAFHDCPLVAAGEAASLSMCTCNDDCRLSFRLDGPASYAAATTPKVDPLWASAWAKVTNHQDQIAKAVAQDPKLFRHVLQATEALVVDPTSIRSAIDGVQIDHRDASELAWAYRS